MSDSRTYCPKCQTYRFKPAGEVCWHCTPAAEKRAILAATEAGQPAPSAPVQSVYDHVTFGGHAVDAPGFTAEQFARAMCRALIDELEIHESNGRHIVAHKGMTAGYHVTRTSCSCKAGQAGTPCKHRAALIFHLDVREPALRRQWAALERRATRKAVAA